MSHARVMLVADTGVSSRLIEWFGGGGWSHFANVLADGTIIDARSDRVAGAPPGVQRRPARYLDSERKWVLLQLGAEHQYEPWVNALVSQLGKPYDQIGIWDFATGSVYDRNWRDQSAWFCSELGVWAQEQAQMCPRLPGPVFRITPGAALLLDIGLGATVLASRG
jgi:hypothetical protein